MPANRRDDAFFAAGVAAILVLAFSLRAGGLAPPSLYLDDVWVALFAREASLADFLALRPHHPAGFLALQSLALRLFRGTELAVQLIPFAAALAVIPLGAWAVRRRTGGVSAGLLAAALLALNPTLSVYSVRAKPYATDALLSLVLVLVTLRCLAEPSARLLGRLALLAPVSVLFSYPAALVGAVGFVFALRAVLRSAPDRARAIGIASAFAAAETALALVFVAGLSNASLREFWRDEFVPLGGASPALAFVGLRSAVLVVGSFPHDWWGLGILAPLALLLLIRRPGTRPAAAFLASLWAALFAAAAARLYPVDDRTTAFAYPLVALLAVWALSTVTGRARSRWLREGVPGFLAAAVVLTSATRIAYPPFDDALVVRALAASAGPADAVLVYPHANWSAAYYGGFPVRLVRSDVYGAGFEARLLRDRTVVLPGVPGYESRPEVLDPALRELLSGHPGRVLYLATHLEVDCCAAHTRIQRILAAAGYASERLAAARGAELLRFTVAPPLAPR